MKTRFWILSLAAIALLPGCAAGPNYRRPALAIPAHFKEQGAWKPARPMDAAPRGRWWTVYRDPQLDRLIARLDISNETIRQAEAEYQAADALVAQARAAYFPLIGASAESTRSHGAATRANIGAGGASFAPAPGTATVDSASLDATWEIDLWGRLRRETEAARENFKASAADLAAARLSAEAALALDYFQLRVTDTERRIYAKNVAGLRLSLKITENQLAAGVAARSDVAQAQTLLQQTRAAAIDLGIQRAQLEHAIAVLIGEPPADFSLPPSRFEARVPSIPAGLPSALLERRPDVAAAERRVAAANANIGVAESAYFPQLTLGGALGYAATSWAGLVSAANRVWAVGPALALPLFEGGARRAATREARANYAASVAAYRQTVLGAFQGVEDDLATLGVLQRERRVQDRATRAADDAERIALNQYRAGAASYLSVVVAQSAALANERASLDIRGRQIAASIALIKDLGGGWDQPTGVASDAPIGAAAGEIAGARRAGATPTPKR